MKKSSIFTIFAAITMVLGFAMTTVGQGNDADNISGNATVIAQVVVTGVDDLEFGNVTPGIDKTISAAGLVVTGGTAGGASENEGTFDVTKAPSTQVTLTWALPLTLDKAAPNAATMDINFDDYGANKCGSIEANSTNIAFTPGGALAISSGAFPQAFLQSSFVVHLGGTVEPTDTQTTGTYTGEITLTATYN